MKRKLIESFIENEICWAALVCCADKKDRRAGGRRLQRTSAVVLLLQSPDCVVRGHCRLGGYLNELGQS